MKTPPTPPNESERLAALRSYKILDTPPEQGFDDLAALAAHICGTPIALVSLVDESRQWFKSRVGLEAKETPREVAFCAHAILQEQVMTVGDAARDERFATNPLVTSDPRIRFYAGAPLIDPEGHALGTICVIDRTPRHLDARQIEAISALGRQVIAQLELRRSLGELSTQLRRAEAGQASARSGEAKLEAIVASALDGIITIDEHGIIRSFNPAAERIFGYVAAEMIGKNVKLLMPSPFSGEHDGYLERYLQTGERRIIGTVRELSGVRKNREIFPMELAVGEAQLGEGRLFTGTVRDVTSRKRTEALLSSQAEAINATQAVIEFDLDGTVLAANERFLALMGYNRNDVVGQNHRLFVTPAEAESAEYIGFWKELRRGQYQQGEFLRTGSVGKQVWFQATYTPILGIDGKPERIIKYATDISQRKLSEAHIQRLSERLLLATSAAGVGIWDWDILQDRLIWDDQMHRLYGVDPKDFKGAYQAWEATLHPDDRHRTRDEVQMVLRGEKDFDTVFRVIWRDGSIHHIRGQARLTRAPDGKPIRMVGTNWDISPMKAAEAALQEKARLATFAAEVGLALTRDLPLGIILRECVESIVRHLDAAFARIWTLDEAGASLDLQASAGLYTHIDGAHARVPVGKFKIGLIALEKMPHLTNDVLNDPRLGDPVWARREGMVSFAGYPLLLENELIGVMAMFARKPLGPEILEALASVSNAISLGIKRKRVELELRRSETRFRALSEGAPIGIFQTDEAGLCEYVNPRWLQLAGMESGQALGDGWREAVHPLDREAAFAAWKRAALEAREFNEAFRFLTPHGAIHWVQARAVPLRSDGTVVGHVGTVENITDLKEAERRQAELIGRIGSANKELMDFAYIVSHDLKAPLRAIGSLANWLAQDYSDKLGDEGKEQLGLLVARAKRMHDLIEGILEYSRVGRIRDRLAPVDLNSLVKVAVEMLSPPAEADIRVETPLPVVVCEEVRIQQVFMNIIGNAIKHARRKDVRIRIGCEREGEGWKFWISDNGPGIDPRFHEKVFQIFQTLDARDDVESTGIGLAVVKKIVEVDGGRIWIESRLGEGAKFLFTLPDIPAQNTPPLQEAQS